jgi:hypothetical protein
MGDVPDVHGARRRLEHKWKRNMAACTVKASAMR